MKLRVQNVQTPENKGAEIRNTQIKHLRKVATPSIFSEKSIFAKQQVCTSAALMHMNYLLAV